MGAKINKSINEDSNDDVVACTRRLCRFTVLCGFRCVGLLGTILVEQNGNVLTATVEHSDTTTTTTVGLK